MESKSIDIWKDPEAHSRTEARFHWLGRACVFMGVGTAILLLVAFVSILARDAGVSTAQAWVIVAVLTPYAAVFVACYAAFLINFRKLQNWPLADGAFGSKTAQIDHSNSINDDISWGEPPDVINIFDPAHDDLVTGLLEAAALQAKDLKSGDLFTVTAPREKFRSIHPHQIIGAVMMRAGEYGLAPGICTDREFQFIKL